MPSPPTVLRVDYTAPGRPDLDRDRAILPFGAGSSALAVAAGTTLYAYHPDGHTLRLDAPARVTTSTRAYLAFVVPEDVAETEFVLVAETSGAAATIRVLTR